MDDIVLYEVKNRVAYLSLNRPEKRNALNKQMVIALIKQLHRAAQDREIKVIVLRGNGKSFCSGADLESLQQMQKASYEENLEDSNLLMELFLSIYRLDKVVIAQIEGHAIAGGCGLATVCDFAFATPKAKFGYTEVRIGFVPAVVMTFLLRKVGEAKAKALLLGGELINAGHAAEIGMITATVEEGEIAEYVKAYADKLSVQNSAQAMGLTKKMIADIQTFPIVDGLKFAAKMNAHARGSEDCKRGISAFLEKKEISW